jgi:hypothetical protein
LLSGSSLTFEAYQSEFGLLLDKWTKYTRGDLKDEVYQGLDFAVKLSEINGLFRAVSDNPMGELQGCLKPDDAEGDPASWYQDRW